MKKIGIITTVLGIPLFVISIFDLHEGKNMPVPLSVSCMIIGVIAAFVGPALFLFPLIIERRKKIANRALLFSLILIAFGFISIFMHWLGARVEIIFGVVIISFFWGTLTFKNKYEKWQIYTRSKRDAFFLSLFDFLGIASVILGFLFKIQSWPYATLMSTIGLVVLAIGMLAWNQKFKKEIVFRKETEDKLQQSLEQIEEQHLKLGEKQKEIIDSIKYAERIQKSLLPTEKYIDSSINRLNEGKIKK